MPAWRRPLPFSYESTGIETHFTQGLDPQPRARSVFAFHRPKTLAAFLKDGPATPVRPELGQGAEGHSAQEPRPAYLTPAANDPATFLGRMQTMPPLIEDGLWPAQKIAIRNLEASLKANKPRALIQMATGRGEGSPLPRTRFTPEQLHWLEMIRDHIAANLGIEPDDFEYSPFAQEGGIGKVHQLFGAELPKVLEALNQALTA